MHEVVSNIREFNRFYTSVIGVLNHFILESDFSLTEVRIMFELSHHPGITAREIKHLLQVDEGYLSRTINKLVKEGIIRKTKLTTDNRTYTLQLTPLGKEIFRKLDEKSSATVAEMIKYMDASERENLVTWMKNIQFTLTKNRGQ